MTADVFRRVALSLPEVAEVEHRERPAFRRAGKIFATALVRLGAATDAELRGALELAWQRLEPTPRATASRTASMRTKSAIMHGSEQVK